MAASAVIAHGDVVPQAVDTSTLKSVGTEWLAKNPYLKDKEAICIGDSAFNQNCARCHGLGAVSGGIAPDLLPAAHPQGRHPRRPCLHAALRRHPVPGSHVDHSRLAGDRP